MRPGSRIGGSTTAPQLCDVESRGRHEHPHAGRGMETSVQMIDRTYGSKVAHLQRWAVAGSNRGPPACKRFKVPGRAG